MQPSACSVCAGYPVAQSPDAWVTTRMSSSAVCA